MFPYFRSGFVLVVCVFGFILAKDATWTKEQLEFLDTMKLEYSKKLDDLSEQLDLVKQQLDETKEKQKKCEKENSLQPRLLLDIRKQVAFDAHLSANTMVASQKAVMYDIITVNLGDGYDEMTGQFRAPVSGTYHFVNTVMSRPGHGIHVNVVKNGVVIGKNWADREGYESGTVAVIAHLNAGDTVWVRDDDSGSESLEHDYNNFSGFLIYQDL